MTDAEKQHGLNIAGQAQALWSMCKWNSTPEASIGEAVKGWNKLPHALVWTKFAGPIPIPQEPTSE